MCGQLLRWRPRSCRLEPPQDSLPGPDATGTLLPAGSAHTTHWARLSPSLPLLRAPVCPSLHERVHAVCHGHFSGITPLPAVSRKHTFLDVAHPPAKIKRSRARSTSAPVAHVCNETEAHVCESEHLRWAASSWFQNTVLLHMKHGCNTLKIKCH